MITYNVADCHKNVSSPSLVSQPSTSKGHLGNIPPSNLHVGQSSTPQKNVTGKCRVLNTNTFNYFGPLLFLIKGEDQVKAAILRKQKIGIPKHLGIGYYGYHLPIQYRTITL